MTQREIWKDIRGWPLHQVSSMGRVRALPGAKIRHRTVKKIELRKLTTMVIGYIQIAQGHDPRYVHHLVLAAFRGPRPAGAHSRHINGNRADNRLSNLRWGTRAQNEADKVRHGLSNRGKRNGQAKLTEAQVRAIRAATGPRGIVTKLAIKYGIAHSAISLIRSGKNWGHLDTTA